MSDLYNPEKLGKTSGKEIKAAPATGSTGVIDVRTKTELATGDDENKEGIKTPPANEPTDEEKEKEEQARIAAQATMSPEEIEADNKKHADAQLTDAQRLEKESQEKAAQVLEAKKETEAEKKVLDKILSSLGVKSLDELKNKIPAAAETEEEKTKREQTFKANLAQFAVKHDLMSMDEITSLENLKKLEPRQLAYNAFAADYKEVYKDRVDADDPAKKMPVTEAEIEDAFNDYFHINSENAALKKAGEKQLDVFAKQTLKDTEEKYQQTVEDFQEYEARAKYFPVFKTAIKEIMDSIPNEITFGEGDNKIVITTDKMDKAAIEKLYTTNEGYDAFYKRRDNPDTIELLRAEVNERLLAKNIKSVIEIAHAAGRDIGRKEGSDVGAKTPFDEKQASATNKDNSGRPKLTREAARKEQAKFYSGAER